ncbi:MAG: nucleotidyltransferase domain-containing protein [Burkholderiales bacterium]|nr:nucleotidyltransferase domain-containing protein [Burkholderiales bacterium]
MESLTAALTAKIQAIYLHGSWATRWTREDSDIDLAILAQARLSFKERTDIFGEVYAALGEGNEIDLAELFHADSVFSAQVVSGGERILVSDRAAADRFEMMALSNYARLNEERMGIILENDVAAFSRQMIQNFTDPQ